MFKKILLLMVGFTLLIPNYTYAGFWSQFFANVASDSLKGTESRDPLIKEKKIQGALAVMGFYNGKATGDFDTFESRTAIKKYQKNFNLEETGFLSDKEKSQLAYLSSLFTELKKGKPSESKRNSIFDEIDSTKSSMIQKGFLEKNLSFLSEEKSVLRVVSSEEDADVYINNKKVGNILLGYYTQPIELGSYNIEVKKSFKHWEEIGKKSISISDNGVFTEEISTNSKYIESKPFDLCSGIVNLAT